MTMGKRARLKRVLATDGEQQGLAEDLLHVEGALLLDGGFDIAHHGEVDVFIDHHLNQPRSLGLADIDHGFRVFFAELLEDLWEQRWRYGRDRAEGHLAPSGAIVGLEGLDEDVALRDDSLGLLVDKFPSLCRSHPTRAPL